MQCPSCTCSASREVVIASVKYLECEWCGNLHSGETGDEEELQKVRQKLQEANEIVARLEESLRVKRLSSDSASPGSQTR